MNKLTDLFPRAAEVQGATNDNENTAFRIGGLFGAIIETLISTMPSALINGESLTVTPSGGSITISFTAVENTGEHLYRSITIPAVSECAAGLLTPSLLNELRAELNRAVDNANAAKLSAERANASINYESTRAMGAEKEISQNAIAVGGMTCSTTTDDMSLEFNSLNGWSSGSVTIPAATTEKAGVMSAEDKKKLDTLDNKQITIVGYGDRGTAAGISKVGEIYLSTNGALRRCIEFHENNPSENKYESVPFVTNGIYIWNNELYRWDGTSLISIACNNVDFSIIRGYAIKSSVPSESANYSYSSPILLKRGYSIVVNMLGGEVYAISRTNETGSSFTNLVTANNSSIFKKYSYTAYEDMYVALCWRHTVFEKPIGVEVKEDGIVKTIEYIDKIYNINIPMQGGKLNSSTGYMHVATDNRDEFTMYIHSVFYYNVKSIESVELEENESCKIFCFDDKYKFIGSTNDLTIKKGTEWIKFEITNTEEYKILRNIKASIKGFLKTSLNVSANTTGVRHFSFEVQEPLIEQENGSAIGQCINKRHFDNGFVMLPPNYDPSGVPVPLIIFWHGTGGYDFANKDSLSYKDYLTFLTYNGYAVADCSGMSDKYQIGEYKVAGHDCRMNPMALSCFKGLYDFISKNYNIKRDGAYVFGKSNGGLGTVMLGYTQPFPIKALGSLAGSLSLVASFRYSSAVNLNYWLKQFGIEADYDFAGYLYQNQTQDIVEYISSNANRYSNFDPMTIGTDIDAVEFARLVFDNGYINHTMNGEALLDMVNSTKKFLPKPIKIWHAEDDESVPIETSEFFKTMIDKTHGICYLRRFPKGVGGHHAVDNSTIAPKTIYMTKYNGDVEIPVAYAELVEWFNQW